MDKNENTNGEAKYLPFQPNKKYVSSMKSNPKTADLLKLFHISHMWKKVYHIYCMLVYFTHSPG